MIPLWYLFSYKYCYRSLPISNPPAILQYLVDKADDNEGKGVFRRMFWVALLLLGISAYLVALPFMRWFGMRRRIRFYRALKLHYGMYYRDTIHEYEEAMRAEEIIDGLSR